MKSYERWYIIKIKEFSLYICYSLIFSIVGFLLFKTGKSFGIISGLSMIIYILSIMFFNYKYKVFMLKNIILYNGIGFVIFLLGYIFEIEAISIIVIFMFRMPLLFLVAMMNRIFYFDMIAEAAIIFVFQVVISMLSLTLVKIINTTIKHENNL